MKEVIRYYISIQCSAVRITTWLKTMMTLNASARAVCSINYGTSGWVVSLLVVKLRSTLAMYILSTHRNVIFLSIVQALAVQNVSEREEGCRQW